MPFSGQVRCRFKQGTLCMKLFLLQRGIEGGSGAGLNVLIFDKLDKSTLVTSYWNIADSRTFLLGALNSVSPNKEMLTRCDGFDYFLSWSMCIRDKSVLVQSFLTRITGRAY